ncbi:MAG: Do family serine endopeptidase [Bacteroidales bacterium]|nr:Do family serine endopeptidase [Bacteroidales bacterium]
MKTKKAAGTFVIALLGGLIAVFVYSKIFPGEERVVTTTVTQPINFANMPSGTDITSFNFVRAAQNSVEAVVHVKTQSTRQSYNPILEFFYGDGYRDSQPVLGFGSGVIISDEGYIVTNNHVVEGSDKVYVTLNDKREFSAKVIGTDPSTDLALLKVDAEGLHYIPWGNSDSLQVGEWVLAVGNPFNLTSTVTAGIVSAKAKNIGIIQDQYRMESFIQTDAAVNRGNSGGALVDINGNLVGINTAIISPSGGYAGISFAVPVAIVAKVVKDLKEFGVVQRAILGVSIQDITAELAKEKDLDKIEGVYIASVRDDGAAKAAGIKEGDVIISINGVNVNSSGELQEQVSRYRPNDIVTVVVKRDGKMKQFEVTLRNLQGKTSYVSADSFDSILGARFEEVSGSEKTKLGIKNGVKVVELKAGKLRAEGVKEGFIITQVNNKPIYSVEDLGNAIKRTNGGVYIEGIYPNGVIQYYAFGLK